jgi:glycine cleavage system aminomethyltransferase T
MPETTQTAVRTPLAEKVASKAAALGTYGGAETPVHFGDVNAEFAAITTTSGIYDLGWRGKIIATGEDRMRWFNGMVTNNIKDVALNQGNYNFVLSAQGRILGDMYLYNRGEYILLDTERSQVETLLETFNHFIIMDDVELSDATDKLTSIGLQGPRSEDILKAIGIVPKCADPLVVCDLTWNNFGLSITRMANPDFLTYEIWLSPANVGELWDALVAAGASPTGTAALEKFRVMAGVPR